MLQRRDDSGCAGLLQLLGSPVAGGKAAGSFNKAECLANIRRFLCEHYPEVGEVIDQYP
jgi:hypothetical protein